MTNFRALCAELHAAFTTYAVDECHHNLLERARAALAEEPAMPTDEDLWNTADLIFQANSWPTDAIRYARAVLARWGNPAPQPPAPVTENPTDEDLLNLHDWMTDEWAANHEFELPPSQYARAVLASWGNPAPQLSASVAKEPRPTDQQLKTFACEWWHKFGFVKNKATCTWVIDEIAPEHFVDFMRSVLARWGNPESVPNPWKDTLLDALVCNFLLNAENEGDPKKALNDLIAWEKQLAVDPLINPPRQPIPVSERLPGPEGLTDDELDDMANEAGLDLAWRPELRRFARFILASGAAAILQPIPVSKELPCELDCDAEGRCWWGRSESNDWFADWTLATHEAVADFCEFSPQTVWLPAHALPLPTAND